MYSWAVAGGGPPRELAECDGDQNLPSRAGLVIVAAKSCRNALDETPLRESSRRESATFGRYGT